MAPLRPACSRVEAPQRRCAAVSDRDSLQAGGVRASLHWYGWFTRQVARVSGRPISFSVAVLVVLLWLATGPLFGFSDTWQLVINTATTIITFLMVFVIQNTQNRDSEALQIKLDELIRATRGAHNTLLDLEEMAEQQRDQLHERYAALARCAREQVQGGASDTDTPEP
jgi:low affinity Fe/Cu permease